MHEHPSFSLRRYRAKRAVEMSHLNIYFLLKSFSMSICMYCAASFDTKKSGKLKYKELNAMGSA